MNDHEDEMITNAENEVYSQPWTQEEVEDYEQTMIESMLQDAPINERINSDPLMMAAEEMKVAIQIFLSEYIQVEDYTVKLLDENHAYKQEITRLDVSLVMYKEAYLRALNKYSQHVQYIQYLEDLIYQIPNFIRVLFGIPTGDPFVHFTFKEDTYVDTFDTSTKPDVADSGAVHTTDSESDSSEQSEHGFCRCSSPDTSAGNVCGFDPSVSGATEQEQGTDEGEARF